MNKYWEDICKKLFVGICIIILIILAIKVYEYIVEKHFNIEGFGEISSIIKREYINDYKKNSSIWNNKFYNYQFEDTPNAKIIPIGFWDVDFNNVSNSSKNKFKMTGTSISNSTTYEKPDIKSLVVSDDVKPPVDFKLIGGISGVSGDIDFTGENNIMLANLQTLQNSLKSLKDVYKFNEFIGDVNKTIVSLNNLYKEKQDFITKSMYEIVVKSLKISGNLYWYYRYNKTPNNNSTQIASLFEIQNGNEMRGSCNDEDYMTIFQPFGTTIELYSDSDYKENKVVVDLPIIPAGKIATDDDVPASLKVCDDFTDSLIWDDGKNNLVEYYPTPPFFDGYKKNWSSKETDYISKKINTRINKVYDPDSRYIHRVSFDIKLADIYNNAASDIKDEPSVKLIYDKIQLLKTNKDWASNENITLFLKSLEESLSNIYNFITKYATLHYEHYYICPVYDDAAIAPHSFICYPSSGLYENIMDKVANEVANTNIFSYYQDPPPNNAFSYALNIPSNKEQLIDFFVKRVKYNTVKNNYDEDANNSNDVSTVKFISSSSAMSTIVARATTPKITMSSESYRYKRVKYWSIINEYLANYNSILEATFNKTLGLPPLKIYEPIAPASYKAIGHIAVASASDIIRIKAGNEYGCVPEHCVVPVRPWRTTDLFYEINDVDSTGTASYIGIYRNPYTGTFRAVSRVGLPDGMVEKVVACVEKCNVIDNLIRANDCITNTAKKNKQLLNETPVIDTTADDAEAAYYEDKIAKQSDTINNLKEKAQKLRIENDKYDVVNRASNRGKLQNYVDTQKRNIDIIMSKLIDGQNKIDVNVMIPANMRIKVINTVIDVIDKSGLSQSQKTKLINQALNITDMNNVSSILNSCPEYDLSNYVKKSYANDVCYGCQLE